MNSLRWIAPLASAAVLVGATACSTAPTAPVLSPEAAVQAVLKATHEGDLHEAAGYFRVGADAYREYPTLFTDFLGVITDQQAATAFSILEAEHEGDAATLWVATFADPEKTQLLRVTTWWFERRGAGWVVVGVR